MENIEFNKCQTPLSELGLEKCPNEVVEGEKYFVYRHRNPLNEKCYVGITKLSLSFRWNHGRGYKRCKLFWRAIQKYGWDTFEHEIVLEGISESEAKYAERYLVRWYKMHNLSYNICNGGEGTTGFRMPKEARVKISQALSEIKSKPVLQYSINGELLEEYKSATEAALILGYGHASVINCASGRRNENLLHGYIFLYKEDLDSLPKRLAWCKDHWKKYKILQYEKGVFINSYDSIHEASRVSGVNRSCIRKNIRGEASRAGKYTWEKVKEEDLYGNEIQ